VSRRPCPGQAAVDLSGTQVSRAGKAASSRCSRAHARARGSPGTNTEGTCRTVRRSKRAGRASAVGTPRDCVSADVWFGASSFGFGAGPVSLQRSCRTQYLDEGVNALAPLGIPDGREAASRWGSIARGTAFDSRGTVWTALQPTKLPAGLSNPSPAAGRTIEPVPRCRPDYRTRPPLPAGLSNPSLGGRPKAPPPGSGSGASCAALRRLDLSCRSRSRSPPGGRPRPNPGRRSSRRTQRHSRRRCTSTPSPPRWARPAGCGSGPGPCRRG